MICTPITLTGTGGLDADLIPWAIYLTGAGSLETVPQDNPLTQNIESNTILAGIGILEVESFGVNQVFGPCVYAYAQEIELEGHGSLDTDASLTFSFNPVLITDPIALIGQGSIQAIDQQSYVIPWAIVKGQGSLNFDLSGFQFVSRGPCLCPPLLPLRIIMSQLSDHLELRLLQASLGLGLYVYPTTIRVTSLAVGDDVTLILNGNTFTHTIGAGETEDDILDALVVLATGAGTWTLTRSTDPANAPVLIVRQDATFSALNVSVTATGTSTLGSSRDVWVGLFLTNPGGSGGGAEVAPTFGYTREQVPFGVVVQTTVTQTANTSDITFGPALGGPWGAVGFIALYDAPVGGNLLYYGPLPQTRSIANGDSLVILAGRLIVRLD